MWFCVAIPGITNNFYFRGNPSDQGLPAAEVNSVLETEVFITPTQVEGWQTAATFAEQLNKNKEDKVYVKN